MDTSILAILIETTIPMGVTFNQWGVAQNGLRHVFSYKRLTVTFDVCALNGVWAGSIDVMGSTWGCSGPIVRGDFIFFSFEECVKNLWERSRNYIIRNKGNGTNEFAHFEKAMSKWLSSSPEEKFNSFKEVDFYAR